MDTPNRMIRHPKAFTFLFSKILFLFIDFTTLSVLTIKIIWYYLKVFRMIDFIRIILRIPTIDFDEYTTDVVISL